ncbi:MAG: hypothetical protein M3Y23_00660 [Actinomycetota bacterium]|nr:hypothetical protein [Actinomycetota bacterium]
MGGKRIIQAFGLLAAMITFGFAAGSAGAVTIGASPTGYTFTSDVFTQAPGELSVFENPPESGFHNVTSSSLGPDGAELFVSESIMGGGTVPVAGTEYLDAGSYPFVCTLHPGMDAELIVAGAGAAVPRPAFRLSVPRQKMKQVRKTRKIKVKVNASSLSNGITIRLLKGRQKISAPVSLNLKPGSAKTVAVKLNGAGRKAVKKIKQGRKFPVSVAGEVPFGKPAKANRKLR